MRVYLQKISELSIVKVIMFAIIIILPLSIYYDLLLILSLFLFITGSYYWRMAGGIFVSLYVNLLLAIKLFNNNYRYNHYYIIIMIVNILAGYGLGRLFNSLFIKNKKLREEIKNREKIEQEILAKEERFRTIIATVPDLITIINKDGIYLDVWTGENKNLYRSRGEMIGRSLDKILPAGVAGKLRKNLEKALQKNKIKEFEYSLQVSGKHRDFEARLTAINQREAVMSVRDITGRKKAEREIRNQRAYFKQLFDNSPEAIVQVDNEEKIIDINKGFEKTFGYKKEEVTGRQLVDFIIPEDRKKKAKKYFEKAQKGEVIRTEAVRQHKDGRLLYVSILGYPIKFEKNKIGRYVIYQDITERKNLEKDLKKNMEKIEKLHDIALEMEKCESREDIYELTVRTAENILNFDYCSLDIVENDYFRVKALSSGISPDSMREMRKDEGLAGEAYMSGESILINDLTEDKKARPAEDTYKSGLTIPVAKYGIFQIVAEEKNYFTRADLRLTELLISHTVAALDRIETAEKLKEYATHDELTGVYNRRVALEILKKKISLAERNFKKLSVCFVDINDLKKANDRYGHEVGDDLILTVTDIIQDEIREMDSICRMGGDEFLIIFPDCPAADAENIWQRINNRFDRLNKRDNKLYTVSVSHGVAEYVPGRSGEGKAEEKIIDNLISQADQKMYYEKERYKKKEKTE